jgi:hypothetical protein
MCVVYLTVRALTTHKSIVVGALSVMAWHAYKSVFIVLLSDKA